MEKIALLENSIKKYLKEMFSPEAYSEYFSSLTVINFDQSTGYLDLEVDSELAKTTIESIGKTLIEQFVSVNFSSSCFISSVNLKNDNINDLKSFSDSIFENNNNYLESDLVLEYSFDNFIPGNNNTLYQVAKKIAESSDTSFCNPLFIHGSSGVGKSHIVHALGNAYQTNFPNKNVKYVSSDKFTNDFIFMLQGNDPSEIKKFKDAFRNIDFLIFDDIQNLIGKSRTIDEFFNILNTLILMKKRIVIVSDRDYNQLYDFPERILTRLSSGFIFKMEKPDYESRMAILKLKASIQLLDDIPDEVYEFLSATLENNVRELEGALNTLLYSAMFENNGEIDLPFTIKTIGKKYNKNKFTKITYTSINNLVAETMSIKVDELRSRKRTKNIATSRKIAIYLVRELIGDSFTKIAKEYNLKDHTSSKYNYDTLSRTLQNNQSLKNIVENIRKKLTN